MLALKYNIPDFILKIWGYKINSKNEKCISFIKHYYGKDKYNFAIDYEIHIFRDKVFNTDEVYVVPHYLRNDRYDWYNSKEAQNWLQALNDKLYKYTKIQKGEKE